jgi:hypothetical protein
MSITASHMNRAGDTQLGRGPGDLRTWEPAAGDAQPCVLGHRSGEGGDGERAHRGRPSGRWWPS